MANIPTGTPHVQDQSVDRGRAPAQATTNAEPGSSLGHLAQTIPTYTQVMTVTPLDNAAPIASMTLQQIAAHQAPTAPVPDAGASPSQSLTITPLPADAAVLLMRPWQIDAFAPPRPVRPEALVFGPMTSREFRKTCTFSITVKGVALHSPYVGAILDCLEDQTDTRQARFSQFVAKSTKDGGVEISFRSSRPFLVSHAQRCCRVGILFKNLQELGVSEQDVKSLSSSEYIFAHLSNADWHCKRSEDAIRRRGELVRFFLITGHFDLAFPLLCDLARTCRATGSGHLLDLRSREILPPEALHLVLYTDPITPREFTQLVCNTFKDNPQFLQHRHCLVQAGRMLLRSIADPAFQSDLHAGLREKVFAALGDLRKKCSKEEAEALLQDLLDLPSETRGELLLDPRARRLLLIAFPSVVEVFEKIEANAYEVFLGRMKTLEDCGIVFSGTFGQSVEIAGPQFDGYVVYTLLELAEAAVMCAGRINWATGVLQFLSERVLDVDVLEADVLPRAEELRDRIQLTVKSEMPEEFDAIKALTDAAIAELKLVYG